MSGSRKIIWNRADVIPAPVYGCTNPTATNYNPLANINDGSCVFFTEVLGCTNPAATNYDPLATTDDGSCVFASNDVVFATASQKLIQTKIGANIFESDLDNLPDWTAASVDLNLQTYYYTPSSPAMNDGNATIVNTFLSAVGANVAAYYPIRSNSVTASFPQYLDWVLSKFNPILVQLDQESLLDGVISNPAYIARSQQVINYIPAVKCCWDAALIYKNNPGSLARNAALAPLTNTDYARQYEQLSPDVMVFSATDQDYNLNLLNNYFGNVLPGYMDEFFDLLVHINKQVILQWHNNDSGSTALPQTLSNFAIGEMTRFTLANTEYFAYLFFMKLGNILTANGTPQTNYYAMKLIAPCYYFTYTMAVAIPLDGCTAQGFSNGANSYGIIINNQTAVTHTILPIDIIIPTKTVSGNFTRSSNWSTGWSDAMQQDIAISEASILIRPYSVSVVTFLTV